MRNEMIISGVLNIIENIFNNTHRAYTKLILLLHQNNWYLPNGQFK